ncbi:extracellular solute-binding protein [Paenibacillus sp. HB172176]|uniref:extracellular solute-binding protein n=1 Tax=Paenibacillus sp. HB172176 TaxID=2493690 RepID=UPI00143B8F20|nr:extracellular solute-binding protein [Paenibacillus sp. HB172176]
MKQWTTKRQKMGMLLSILLATSLAAGCSNNQGGNEPQASTGSTDGNETQVDNKTEEVGFPDQLKYWVPLGTASSTKSSLSEVGVYQKLQELTGTKVEFTHPSEDGNQQTEQLNIMIASGNLPDVVETNWLNVPRGPQNAIDEGTIIRLNELIEEYAPNLRKYLDENPEMENLIKTDEGSIYAFPFLRGDKILTVFYGPTIRKDWLDKLNLEVPTTIEEWENTFIAFRDQDPNGNGEKDEIPFTLRLSEVRSEGTNALIGAWGIASRFYQVDGEVRYGEIQPEYKEFLTTMQRWYEEGLIDPDFAANDSKLIDARMTGNQLGALYAYNGGGIGKYTGLMTETNPDFNLVGILNPTLNKGDTPALGQMDKIFNGTGAAISGNAKNPEAIVKWLDQGYSEEGHMLFNFGIEGESYEMVDGYPTFTDQITKNADGLPMAQALAEYARSISYGPFVQDRRYIEQYYNLDAQSEALETWSQAKNEIQMPPVTLTAEESQKFGNIMNDVNTYAEEMITKFIMGAEKIEKFDDFVANLKKFKIEEAIAIQQAALDRYNNR